MGSAPDNDHLWQMMDRFEAAFPSVWAKTWVVDPRIEEDWRAADKWIRTRLREAGLSERQIQNHSQRLFVSLRDRSPYYFGATAQSDGVVAGVVVPIISHETWGERLSRSMISSERQAWSVPEQAPFNKLSHTYSVYTFGHETAHAVYHSLDHAHRPPAQSVKPGRITQQQDETFSDIAGGLDIVANFDPMIATDSLARIAHLRAIAAVQNGAINHLTIRGLKRAMATIGNPDDEAREWRLTGMKSAYALAQNIPDIAFSQNELDDLSSLARIMKPGDTFSSEAALRVTGELARDTKSPVIYELMRDYIEAVQALVPEDRYDPAMMMRAKLNARRNPLAETVDAEHPRVETVRAEAMQRVALYRSQKRAVNDTGTGHRPAASSGMSAPPKP